MTESESISTHKAEVVQLILEKHPNADSLSVAHIFGYTCCVKTTDWEGVKIAVYIPPDSTVDVKRPEFAFLAADAKSDSRARVKAKKLRGILSFGLLVPAPDGSSIGDDMASRLDVQHYEPPVKGAGGGRLYMGGETMSGPNLYFVKYDLESLRRYHEVLEPGEPVLVTEKLDGFNARYVHHDGKMYCGSRTEWKKEYPSFSHVTIDSLTTNGVPEEKAKELVEKLRDKPKQRNLWWEVLGRTPTLEKFCVDNPSTLIYGEGYGNAGRIKYGGEERFAAFDLMIDGKWVDAPKARDILEKANVPCVPLLGAFPYHFDEICALAEGTTTVVGAKEGTIREGVVVSPLIERYNKRIGRVKLKAVSAEYLSR